MTQNQVLADAASRIAIAFIGEKEKTGHNDGPFVETIEAWYYGDDGSEGEPWCAMFRSWCDWLASVALNITPILPRTDSSTDLYSAAKIRSLLLDAPIPGCIGLLRGTGGDDSKTHCHTFRVLSVYGDLVNTVDGNESNQVEYAQHPIANCDFVMCC